MSRPFVRLTGQGFRLKSDDKRYVPGAGADMMLLSVNHLRCAREFSAIHTEDTCRPTRRVREYRDRQAAPRYLLL